MPINGELAIGVPGRVDPLTCGRPQAAELAEYVRRSGNGRFNRLKLAIFTSFECAAGFLR